MTDKAYIVVNEQQEREVLEKLEREGLKWKGFSKEPTQWLPTRDISYGTPFPYILFGDDVVSWCSISDLKDDYEIIFDGRKEERMSEKYVVSQELMNELEEWKDELNVIDGGLYISTDDFIDLPTNILKWRDDSKYTNENNNRLIAIIRWVNGEDVFEVEKPKKWVVKSKNSDINGRYHYSILSNFSDLPEIDYYFVYDADGATKFDTKEEAESWANSHQEVVEVDE